MIDETRGKHKLKSYLVYGVFLLIFMLVICLSIWILLETPTEHFEKKSCVKFSSKIEENSGHIFSSISESQHYEQPKSKRSRKFDMERNHKQSKRKSLKVIPMMPIKQNLFPHNLSRRKKQILKITFLQIPQNSHQNEE